MVGPDEERAHRERMERVESLIQELEQLPDSKAKACSREIIQGILELHGAALEKILETVADAGDAGLAMIDSMARDDLVGSVLSLHGLHPLGLEARVRLALDKVRPYLRSHGGNVELLGVVEGVVRLRMQGSCHGCPSSAVTLKLAIEEAIYEIAPDVTGIQVEGAVEPPARPSSTFIPAEQLLGDAGVARARVAMPPSRG
jgi:Fe-S cluster biogenesis protein NfuA